MPMTTPTPRATRIQRPALLAMLDGCPQYTLTMIIAPAGSGKSTLLNQWQQAHDGDAIVRINLSSKQLTALDFLQKINHHICQARPHFPVLSLNALTTDSFDIETISLELVDAINQDITPLFIVIDDFHVVTDPLIQRIVYEVLMQLDGHIHVILASRSQPLFSLSHFRLEDRLLLIQANDLRLTLEDLPAFCSSLGLDTPEPQALDTLMHITEGWLAGMKLALLAHRPLHPQLFGQTHHELVSYFADVVLADLPEDEQQFLLSTSIVDCFDLSLCQHLMDTPQCSQLLHQVFSKNLFIQTIEEKSSWYRYHTLFKNFLYQRMQHHHPERLKHLHQRASAYFWQHAQDQQALMHARCAGSNDDYLSLLKQSCERQLKLGNFRLLLNHIKTIDSTQLKNDPAFFIPQIAALIFTRHFTQAHHAIESVRQQHRYTQQPAVVSTRLNFLAQLLNLFEDDDGIWSDASIFNIECAYGDLRDAMSAMVARHHLLKGECSKAIDLAQHAKVILQDLQQDYLSSYADVVAILAERELGHILAARQMTIDFYERYIDQPHTPCWLTASTCMAVSLYEQNRTSEAQKLCDQLIQGVDRSCATEVVYYAYVIAARLQDIVEQPMRSSSLLLQLRRILKQGQYQRLLSQLLVEELSHAIRTHQYAHIQAIADEYHLRELITRQIWLHPPKHYREGWMYSGVAAALYLRAQGQYEQALNILQHVITMLKRSEMRTRLVVAEANYLVILHLQGQQQLALQLLGDLFARVGLQCAVRTVFDEAPDFGHLLYLAHQQGVVQLPDIFLFMYSNVVTPPKPTTTSAALPAQELDPLTAKELEILQLLHKGCSNKEISRLLNISLSTTKWHLKNVFSKLNVSSRTAAIAAFDPQHQPSLFQRSRQLVMLFGLMGCLELAPSLPIEDLTTPSRNRLQWADS